jgi:2-oxoglutarate ferredoxin oxidoreductase subunit delta
MRVFARTPLDSDQQTIPRGQIFLITERCKGCNICIELCPKEVLQESPQMNAKGYHYPEIQPGKEEACIHCEFCSMVCPEFAIYTPEAEL